MDRIKQMNVGRGFRYCLYLANIFCSSTHRFSQDVAVRRLHVRSGVHRDRRTQAPSVLHKLYAAAYKRRLEPQHGNTAGECGRPACSLAPYRRLMARCRHQMDAGIGQHRPIIHSKPHQESNMFIKRERALGKTRKPEADRTSKGPLAEDAASVRNEKRACYAAECSTGKEKCPS